MSLFDDASLVLTPNGYKASKLYSIKPTSGLGDMTVVRATTARRVNSAGLIESVATNVPRLDYTGGGCPRILVEPARTNLLLQSQTFDNASWSKTSTTVTANTTTSPDGTLNADSMVVSTVDSRVTQVLALGAGAYTTTVYVKILSQTTAGTMRLQANVDGANVSVTFTPTTEWQRVTATYNPAIGITTFSIRGLGFIGTIAIWGAQIETGSNATSYIPTVAATVTRNADVISKTGISSLIGQTEGTLYAEINITTFNNGVFFSINDGTAANRIQMYKFTDNKIYCDRISATQSVTTSISSSALSVGTYKVAFAYQSGNSYLYINGTQVGATSAATFTFGSMGKVNIGSRFDDTSIFNDRIELATLFPTRLTNAQLATLTTL